ncbi:hypothetical protein [Cryobacterium psychrophilum]|uniref:Cell wall-binding repeat-containing protein n=1 Tax=Cryobacterium psychrophilum TaxID=41988 RepID=A0A4Y8KKN6_9MICO|nr:hypothetical protein [Cryobacterium psychrophilum]TFD77392.1 hypothetical protein E3T53_11230 [Cryobacterium psychrophilum]
MRTLRRSLTLLLVATVAALGGLTGCMAEEEASPPSALQARTALPIAFLTVVADVDPVLNAVAVSGGLYETSEFVVTAPVGNDRAQLLAASAAVDLGVPLLLTPEFGAPTTSVVSAELTRLHASYVVSVGGGGRSVSATTTPSMTRRAEVPRTRLSVPATADAVNAILPNPLRIVRVASAPLALTALAQVDPLAPVLLELPPTSDTAPTPNPSAAESEIILPPISRATALTGGLMLATDDPAQLAGVATARAASVMVTLVPSSRPNPQASAETVTALGAAAPTAVLAVGEPFAAEPSLDYKVRAAASGTQVPGGGQLLFPDRRFVALYGTPSTPVLGVLGEQGVAEAIARAKQMAAAYQPFSDRPVIPMHEIIATVAAADAGGDGNYSNEIPAEKLRPWVEAAGAAGIYVVLDLQPGRTDFLSQAQRYSSLLELPYVGLALDPEWRLGPDQRHLAQIGRVDIDEINAVVGWLAELTNEHALPQKLLVLHQFRPSMLQNRGALDMTHPELALLLHVDGLGGQPDKQATWSTLHRDAPLGVAWGWKNFIDEDRPMLTPEQTMTGVAPTPDLVTYQ